MESLNAPNLQDLLEQQYGVATDVSMNVVSATSTPAILCSNNPKRVSLLVQNLGNDTVYISFNSDVTSSKGIALSANTGSFTLGWQQDFSIVGYQMYVVDPTGTSNVLVVENYTVSH